MTTTSTMSNMKMELSSPSSQRTSRRPPASPTRKPPRPELVLAAAAPPEAAERVRLELKKTPRRPPPLVLRPCLAAFKLPSQRSPPPAHPAVWPKRRSNSAPTRKMEPRRGSPTPTTPRRRRSSRTFAPASTSRCPALWSS